MNSIGGSFVGDSERAIGSATLSFGGGEDGVDAFTKIDGFGNDDVCDTGGRRQRLRLSLASERSSGGAVPTKNSVCAGCTGVGPRAVGNCAVTGSAAGASEGRGSRD